MIQDDSLIELFLLEVQNYSRVLEEELFIKPKPDLEVLIRAAHSIRGAGRIIQLEDIAEVAGALENYFERVNEEGLPIDSIGVSINFFKSISHLSVEKLKEFAKKLAPIVVSHLEIIAKLPEEKEEVTIEPIEQSPVHVIETTVINESNKPIVDTSLPDLSDFSMLELFKLEIETQVNVLNEGILALENDLKDIEQIDTLMRAAHSIKGAARIVQIEAVVQLSHIMEDCFIAAKEGKLPLESNHLDVFFESVDMIAEIGKRLTPDDPNALSSLKDDIQQTVVKLQQISHLESIPPIKPPIKEVIVTPDLSPTTEEVLVTPEIPPSTIDRQETKPSRKTEEPIDNSERVVRVSKDNLNRLMGLAGESLVAANWLQPFADSLLKLKNTQTELSRLLEKINDHYSQKRVLTEYELSFLKAALQKAEACRQILTDRLNELELFARQTGNLSDRLYREVIASHMRPFADGIQAFPRMVRDVAKKLGKQVQLEILGKSTQVDRDILEKLEAPLTHILRNAIDHGIEPPEERIAKGKPPVGTIRLEAAHRAGMLSITIGDDGRGINIEHLRQKIIRKGLATQGMVSQMTDAELIDFLFLPGFSTASQVTEISGRGVGLDIVQSMVQEVGGIVRATSQFGKGMTFHLQLPLTLSVIRTLLVTITGETYAFPLSRIDSITLVSRNQIHTLENREYFTFNHQQVGIISAAQVLQLQSHSMPSNEIAVVLISDRTSSYGLVVDRFLGEKELVVRPLDPRLGKVPNISAAALMEDGSPTLIVDVEDLVRSIDKLLNGNNLSHISYDDKLVTTKKRILIVDDSLTVREVERKLLENQGYEVAVAIDGMDGWNVLRTDDRFDLVISDVDMPRMNGLELVSQIRSHPTLKALPVVIVSYKDREEDRLRGLEVGADFYLTKSSFHDNSLIQAVQDLIGAASDRSITS